MAKQQNVMRERQLLYQASCSFTLCRTTGIPSVHHVTVQHTTDTMTFEVYLDPITINCRKVLAGLDLCRVEYTTRHVDYFKGEQKSEEYKKINPFATIPAARDGDMVLTESNAIMQYGADIAGTPEAASAYPKDLKKRANVNRWLLWETSSWFPSCYIYLVENVVKPLLKAQPDQAVIDKEAPNFHNLAQALDEQFSKTKYICGPEVTIADIAIASPMHLHGPSKLPLEKYPNLRRWMSDIESLPEWKATQGAVEKALLPGTPATANAATTNGHQEAASKATFNYTRDVPEKTQLFFYETPEADGIHEPGDDPHEMPIYDGYKVEKPFSIDENGFGVHDFHTEHKDWVDEDEVKSSFYPQVVEFLKKTTGAKRVLVFDHTIRTKANAAKKLTQETNTTQRSPVMLVHCDYTNESAPLRVKQLLPEDADTLLKNRVAFINVWKPINNPVEERPLAMCDVNTSSESDFFKLFLRYRDRTGENYVMRHNKGHKWYYYPNMTPEQVILLKTYDSEPNVARFVGHSAFEDPNTKPNARTRESIEIRTICFF